jgi:hypothetical protein
MVPRVPPYPPPPRHAPPDLGGRLEAPPVLRAVGIAGHLLGVGLYAAVPVAAAGAALSSLAAEETHLIVRIGGFAVCTVLAFLSLKSLLPRRLPLPPAVIPVLPADQPTAYAFVQRVAEDLRVPAPRRMFAGSGVELRLGGRRSLLDLVRAPRWELHLGLWLWHALTLSEFQALIARTLAPTAGGRAERLRSTARTLLETLVDGVDLVDEAAAESDSVLAGLARAVRGAHRGVLLPVRLVARLLLRIDPLRDDSRSDDLAAVRVAGSDALVHGVLRSDFAAAALRAIDEALHQAADSGLWTADLYDHLADGARAVCEAHNDFTLGEVPALRGPTAGKHAEVFDPGQRYLSKLWAGFPPPDDREQEAKREFVAAERDDRPAAELLEEADRLRERLTALRYIEVLETDDDYLPLPPATVRRWLATSTDAPLPAKYAGCYDGGRKIEPGTALELQDALGAESWDEARLLSTARGLYARAAERATAWRTARTALDRLLRKTLYDPVRRQRALAEDLEDDARKAGRWLTALDRWAYVVHVHMAARLSGLGRHEVLLARYESVMWFQPLAADARRCRNRVAAFVEKLEEYGGHTPYRLGRDAAREFAASRRDFGALLADAATIKDPLLREWTGDVALDEFLFSHEQRPPARARGTVRYGRRLLHAWEEVEGKARWLHRLGVGTLLELHEVIEREFAAQVPAATGADAGSGGPPPLPPALPGLEDAQPTEPEPEEAQFVPDVPHTPSDRPTDEPRPSDDWAGTE